MAGKIKQEVQVAQITEENAQNAPVKDIKWYGTNAETEKFRLEDPASGRKIIVRHFDYMYPPGRRVKPTKAQILTKDYLNYLKNGLWADELEMIMDPKVVFYKKGFRVFVTCQAKKGSIIPYHAVDMAKPLQEQIQAHARN